MGSKNIFKAGTRRSSFAALFFYSITTVIALKPGQ
jgi:hypothetical protein